MENMPLGGNATMVIFRDVGPEGLRRHENLRSCSQDQNCQLESDPCQNRMVLLISHWTKYPLLSSGGEGTVSIQSRVKSSLSSDGNMESCGHFRLFLAQCYG